jgi:hypothetical protein
MCTSFSGQPKKGGTHFREIETNLEKSVELINQFGSDGEMFSQKVKTIVESIIQLKEDINQLQVECEFIKTTLGEIFEILIDQDKRIPEINKLAKQVSDISKSIRVELESINEYFKSAEDETVILETLIENNFESKFKANLQKFSESIFSIVKILNSDNFQVETILKENGELGHHLAVDIQTSIEKVKYYDFFEQVIEEIILELNNIYLTIRSDAMAKSEEQAIDLESLKNRYTMQSQRIIHSRVLNENEEEPEAESEEDNIEFF